MIKYQVGIAPRLGSAEGETFPELHDTFEDAWEAAKQYAEEEIDGCVELVIRIRTVNVPEML